MAGKDFFEDMNPSDDEEPSGDPKGHGPMWYLNKFHDLVDAILVHKGLPWFFIGLGIEALSICVYFYLVGTAYPVVDTVTGLALGFGVLYWQWKQSDQE